MNEYTLNLIKAPTIDDCKILMYDTIRELSDINKVRANTKEEYDEIAYQMFLIVEATQREINYRAARMIK